MLFGLALCFSIGPAFFGLIQTSLKNGARSGIAMALGIFASDLNRGRRQIDGRDLGMRKSMGDGDGNRARTSADIHNARMMEPTGQFHRLFYQVLGLGPRNERAGTHPGPVAATPARRLYFLVLPNARAKVAKTLTGLGWGRTTLDLICRGAGDYIVAPPSRMGTRGQVQWVRAPADSARWLPDPEEILAPLAYACALHRIR